MHIANAIETSRLAALIAEPNGGETANMAPETLRRIQLFRGLILRVKHSFIWTMAPHTAARLERTGFLLKAFADYGADSPLSAFEGTQRARTRRFLEYLCQAEFPVDVRVSGVARHELHLISADTQSIARPKVHIAATPGSRFRFARDLTVEPYDAPPDQAEGAALCPNSCATVLGLYLPGQYRLVQGAAMIAALSRAWANDRASACIPAGASAYSSDLAPFLEGLCADGYITMERIWKT